MEINMRRINFVLVSMLATAPALAHGPNGGRVTDLGPFHAELTAKGSTVELYVTDTLTSQLPWTDTRGSLSSQLAARVNASTSHLLAGTS